MKNLLLALLLLVGFAASAETNWVIAHTGYNVATIYALEGSGNDTYVSIYPINNPTTGILKDIGLPEYLWSELSNSNGVFDTRLVNALSEKEQLTTKIEDLQFEINDLKETSIWRLLGMIFFSVIATMLAVILANKH